MNRAETIRFLVLRSLGNFLVLLSLYGVLMTFGPILSAELNYRVIQFRGVTYAVDSTAGTANAVSIDQPKEDTKTPDGRGFSDVLTGDKTQVLNPADPSFSILIPKLGASAKVFPNVDASDKSVYLPLLKQGVAHASGSSFPGLSGTVYLFAHSADNWWDVGQYNAVFYTLHNLSEGDDITVFFENRRYDYHVSQKIIADPREISYLTKGQEGEDRLVLQTCWPPGTTLQRLFVVASPKENRE